MAKDWQPPKGKFPYVRLSLLLLVVAAVAVFFVRNNPDLIRRIAPVGGKLVAPKPAAQTPAPAAAQAVAEPAAAAKATPTIAAPAVPAAPASSAVQPQKAGHQPGALSVAIPAIRCKLADRDNLMLNVSITVFVSGAEARQEILLKRESLKVIVQKVLSRYKLADIVIDNLRTQLAGELNRTLENGAIQDIEFDQFQPVM